ncbi:hypothetical protein OSB04_005642 [Centaurea solstitialis]|uniref:Cytochrome P450 n=1 Tax=Centaurea solstitialis TaxID=347529 RepID=A0AA38WGP0_9ASTR|nr:hypothetical protein OSB04_005642 [Centaurea solstitialis]
MDITSFLRDNNLPIPLFLLSTIIFLLLVVKLTKPSSLKNLPPGPPRLPIIGNLHQVGDRPHVSTAKFAKEYGPLISLRLGKQVLVVASSPEAAMEILKTQDRFLSSRVVPTAFQQTSLIPHSVIWSECNQTWKSLRTLCRTEMFSSKALESQSRLRDERLGTLKDFLHTKQGQLINVEDVVFTTLFNTLSSIIFARDFLDLNDEHGTRDGLKESLHKIIEYGGITKDFGSFFPMFERFDLQGIRKGTMRQYNKTFAHWEDIIEERRARINSSTWSSEQAQSFLDRMLENGFSNDQINQLVTELFVAGTNTTTTSVVWAMTELVRHKEVMSKIVEEIGREIKSDTMTDSELSKLPYLQACIKEAMRLHPPVPLLLPHMAAETCEVMNYTIPKNSKIFVNLWAMGRDPKVWDDPLSFKPERFIGSKVDFKGQDFELLPFGSGRRMCPGMPSGVKSVQLILASLIREFDLALPEDVDPLKLDMNDKFGIALKMETPLKLLFKRKPESRYKLNTHVRKVPSLLTLLCNIVDHQNGLLEEPVCVDLNLPPGPPRLPIIGNLHQVGDRPHVSTAKFAKEYGPLISLRLGKQVLVVASSPEAAMEILKTQDRFLSSRVVPTAFQQTSLIPHSVIWSECNQTWKSLRTLCRTEMFSSKALESQSRLRDERLGTLKDFLHTKQGQLINVEDVVFTTLFNTLSSIIFARDFLDLNDEHGTRDGLKESLHKIIEYGGITKDFGSFFPMFERFDLQGIRKGTMRQYNKTFAHWEDIIEERRARINSSTWSSEQAQSFVDRMLENGFSNDQINQLVTELFVAGTNTTTTSVVWAMTELVRHKEVMSKIVEEIGREIKSDTMTDSELSKLPYLQACIKEAMRLHPPVPLLLPHMAAETCEVMNYTIPKNSKIFVNLWAMGRDPKVWDDPLSFKPERFIGSKVDFKGQDFELLPFGSGRRMCPGMPSGVKSVQLILASLIREFDLALPEDVDPLKLDMNDKFGIALKMETPLKLLFKRKPESRYKLNTHVRKVPSLLTLFCNIVDHQNGLLEEPVCVDLRQQSPDPSLLLSTIIFLLLVVKLTKPSSLKNLPPGPPRLPIIGNLHQVGDRPHVSTAKFAKEYGPLISLRLGKQVLVVASSPEAAMEILKTQDRFLSSRVVPTAFQQTSLIPHSVIWSECNQTWKSLRTLCRTEMFSSKALESQSRLRDERLGTLKDFLHTKQGQLINVEDVVFTTLFNTLSSIIFARDFLDLNDEHGTRDGLKESLHKIIEYGGITKDFGSFFPMFERFDLQGIRKGTMRQYNKTFAHWEDIIEERRARINSSTWSSEQAQSFLDRMLENGFSNDQINQLVTELFVAGTNTTTTSVVWAMTELVRHKEVMSKIVEEIGREIKSDTMTDSELSKLPYLQACIKEAMRLHPPVPLLLPHMAAETCEVMNYTIPKNSKIFVNLWAMGRDPKVWDDPLSFKPERFIGSKVDFKGQDFELLPFGSGGGCVPECHQFDLALPEDVDPLKLDMNDKFGIALKMETPLKLLFKRKPESRYKINTHVRKVPSLLTLLCNIVDHQNGLLEDTVCVDLNLPPGPPRLPIIGNLHQVGDRPHVSTAKFAKEYGPLISLRLGKQVLVVASSPEAAMEILKTQDRFLSSRVVPTAFQQTSLIPHSVIWSECNQTWKSLRTLCRTEMFSSKALESQSRLRDERLGTLKDFLHTKQGQ